MKHETNRSLAVLALASLVAVALAQTPPHGPGGPEAGPGREARARRPGGMDLLKNPRVREELRLTEAQIAQIQALAPKDLGPRPEPGRGPADGPIGGPDRPEGAPKVGDAKEPGGLPPREGPEERLRTILDAEQYARYRQLRLQRDGVRAMTRPDVAKELDLTPEQLGTMRPAPPTPGETPQAGQAAGRPDAKAEEARLMGTLTEEQRAKWRTMTGRPFDFGPDREARGPDETKPPTPPRA